MRKVLVIIPCLFLAVSQQSCRTDTEVAPAPTVSTAPLPQFERVTEAAGLADFIHQTGANGNKWFPEAMGSGCGFADVDNDGWPDILLAGGGTWSDAGAPALHVFRNLQNGSFEDITSELGVGDITGYSYGVAAADYDGDGDIDVFLATLGKNLLFQNQGGTFVERGAAAGLQETQEWSTSAVFLDANQDGHLDLFVGSYVDWSPEKDLVCTLKGDIRSYCTPELYTGIPSRFYLNNGDGTFRDASEDAGFIPAPGKTLGAVSMDYDADGFPDLFVANDTQPDLIYRNLGDGTFEEIGARSGFAYDENGRARAGMGIDAALVDDSGQPSIFVGNFSKEMIAVFRHAGNDIFVDRAAVSQIGRPSLLTLTFGLNLFDADLDGDLDLLATNGHVQQEIEQTTDGVRYRQAPHLFLNNGNGLFEDRAPDVGGPMISSIVGRGAALADYDKDGDIDVLLTENGGPAHLLRNESNAQPYLRLKLTNGAHNRDAIGAVATVFEPGRRQSRTVKSGTGFMSVSESTLTFGIPSGIIDSVLVRWPDGTHSVDYTMKVGTETILSKESNDPSVES